MRRDDICLYLGPAARAELRALATSGNTPRKLVWRAGIVLAMRQRQGTWALFKVDYTGLHDTRELGDVRN